MDLSFSWLFSLYYLQQGFYFFLFCFVFCFFFADYINISALCICSTLLYMLHMLYSVSCTVKELFKFIEQYNYPNPFCIRKPLKIHTLFVPTVTMLHTQQQHWNSENIFTQIVQAIGFPLPIKETNASASL